MDGRAAIPDGVLGKVVIEGHGRDALLAALGHLDEPVEERADLATQ